MADIELVIKIPEELYKANHRGLEADELWDLRIAIKNGTPLPKGHGRLIDADKLKQKIETADNDIMEEDWYKLYDNVISDIDNAYAIIEAYTESEQ